MKLIASRLTLVASPDAALKVSNKPLIAIWADLSPRNTALFANSAGGVWQLPELSPIENENLLSHFYDLISNIGVASGRESVWWYTWTSSRDRFHSSILADMEIIARFQKALDIGLPEHLVMVCKDPYLADVILKIARTNKIAIRVAIKDRFRWARARLTMKAKPMVGSVRTCGRLLLIKRRIKQDSSYINQAKLKPERTILVTWIKSDNLQNTGQPNDTYFGLLPKFLETDTHSVTVFGDIYPGLPIQPRRSGANPFSPVLTAAPFISNWAIFKAFVRGVLSSVPIHVAMKSETPGMAQLLRRDVHLNRDSIVYGLLLETSLRRLVQALEPTHIIHMCENNPWERACSQAAHSMTPQPPVSGYMHCAVILSHTKIIITEKEKPFRPRPSKLICTGERAGDIMIKFGGHAPDEVVGACALRQAYMTGFRPRCGLNRPVRNVLVILEGLPNMSHLVRFVWEALDGDDRFCTVIRPHPAYRFDQIIADVGVSASDFKTLTLSKNTQIVEDFQNADLVIYKGSTAAMEAGYMGIPLIHYDYPYILTDDPLFETTDLKKVVAKPEELVPAILEFDSMNPEDYVKQSLSLRRYIDDYLTIPRPEHADYFRLGSPKVAAHD